MIAQFLGGIWTESKVKAVLEVKVPVEKGEVDEAAVRKILTTSEARKFVRTADALEGPREPAASDPGPKNALRPAGSHGSRKASLGHSIDSMLGRRGKNLSWQYGIYKNALSSLSLSTAARTHPTGSGMSLVAMALERFQGRAPALDVKEGKPYVVPSVGGTQRRHGPEGPQQRTARKGRRNPMGEPMVEEAARPQLNTLAKLAAELNEASDRYTAELKSIEAELQRLNLGIECFLEERLSESDWQTRETGRENQYGEPIEEHYYAYWRLGFGKHRGEWRLLIREYERTGDPSSFGDYGHSQPVVLDETPLLDASRDIRIAAAEKIPTLLALLEQEARKKLDSLKKVTDRES